MQNTKFYTDKGRLNNYSKYCIKVLFTYYWYDEIYIPTDLKRFILMIISFKPSAKCSKIYERANLI